MHHVTLPGVCSDTSWGRNATSSHAYADVTCSGLCETKEPLMFVWNGQSLLANDV